MDLSKIFKHDLQQNYSFSYIKTESCKNNSSYRIYGIYFATMRTK